jgi:hypothetical protein
MFSQQWDITPCSPLIVNRRFGGTFRFQPQVEEEAKEETSTKQQLVSCLAFSTTLKMEETCSSGLSVDL